MSQTFNFTFDTLSAYEKYKQEIIASGGEIKNDFGSTLLGFTAVIPLTLVNEIRSGGIQTKGIKSFDPDGTATIAAAAA